ncbi:glycoside hydrolase family 76 protein [Actinacidiphila paucisporea]|uniref:Ricin-type beta-trefoil lectin domain-containing protein n=1 Tax=Actinacidiphila paucisporea TaxID=310782 RepID=A0A1M7QFB7_9ACTN|nr:glycoside hydrolase family 76 protein [Actinacidiphila paucisporea]SHN29708.1 Ricin-type beta-trefoil lectin domain-containing protein [Actinacidiphila paucisporea]
MTALSLRQWTARAVVALLSMLLLVSGTTSAQAAPTPAGNSIAVLMQSYDANNGRIDAGGWWTSAVSLSTVMTYHQATGDTQYDYAISGAFAKNSNFTNDYIDDTGWWALVWLQAYDITGNTSYLNMARTTTNYMHSYWDSACGGGVYWSTAKQYKASIANELFLAATAGLHNRIPGDTTYGGWATAEWNWFKNSGLINGNLVRDGLNVPNCTFSTANYSYNQGVILQGLIEQSRATGDTSLVTTAKTIADAAVSRFNHNGVLYDGCEPNCTGDGSAFKGIFARYLRALATATKSTQYDTFLATTASSILANDTNGAGQQGNSFVGPFALWTPTTQASAAEALVAALGTTSAPPPGTTGVLRGQESSRCVDVPAASHTNGTQVALWDCNGAANQSWTSDTSGRLTVYGTKCLDVRTSGTADGTPVQIYDCNGTSAQQWNLRSDGTVVNTGSGKCLDATGHGTADNTLLEIWTCNGGTNQKWSR